MKRNFIPYIYIACVLWNFNSIYGQNLILKISAKDSLNDVVLNSIYFQKKHSSKISLNRSLDSIKIKLEQKGFLNYKLDTIIETDSIYNAKFNLNNVIKIVRVFYSDENISKEKLQRIVPSVTDHYFDVEIENLKNTLNAIVGIYESRGSSFSEVSLQNISIKKDFINAYLEVETSELRKIDKIVITGYTDFPKTYLNHFLGLRNNTLFNKEKLNKASGLTNTLPFVTEIKPPEVLFTKDSTIIYLYLKKATSNKFDGLIGFNSKENGSGISFNGYLDLTLNNMFNGGESFSVFWKNNGAERQVFNIKTSIPYIFSSKFSPETELNIFKQDSTFINTKAKVLIPYLLNERSSVGISLQTESSSNLLNNNLSNDVDDFQKFFFGVHYDFIIPNTKSSLFQNKFNVVGEIEFGNRKNSGSVVNQSKLFLKTSYLWSLNYKNHIFLQNESSAILSDNFLTNELFRIGGVNSIRGFSEESIFATTYSYVNIEYRFLTNNSSYLYSISDIGYFDNKIIDKSSQMYSLGFGYSFKTTFGLLDISYAIGKYDNEAIKINNSKLHLKIVNFF